MRAAGYEALFRAYRGDVSPARIDRWSIPRNHFEPYWPLAHVRYFARGGAGLRDLLGKVHLQIERPSARK